MRLLASLCTSPALRPAIFLALLCAGCANPGTPRPPSLHLPQIVTDLTAEREGDEVHLHWTTPAKTTDQLKVSGPMTAEICRVSTPVQSQITTTPQSCLLVHTQIVQSGPSEATDSLPPSLRTDPEALIQYQIRLLNAQHRTAGSSISTLVAGGSAPPLVAGLQIRATAEGALLQWEPKDAADSMELDRRQLPSAITTDPDRRPLERAVKKPAELHLRVGQNDATTPFRNDAGGTVDATAHRGETYVYTATRVRKVLLDGQALEIRSEPSQPVSITMRDEFPPKPPAGLETIAVGQNGASPAIDLSWRPNIEPDLAGYLVYRQEYRQELGLAGTLVGARVKLTPVAVQEPGFHDTTVLAGHRYSYTVTAVDASGNESAPAKPAFEELPGS